MIRVLVSLSSIVALVSADRAIAGMSLPAEAPTPPAINCEQPANITGTPAPDSEGDKSGIGCPLGEVVGTGRARDLAAPDPAEQEAIREMLDLREVSSIMHRFATHADPLSQVEVWWRERSKFEDAAQDNPTLSTMKEALAEMDTWWRERTDLHNGVAVEQSPSAVKDAIAQMDAWWQQGAELGHGSAKNPEPAVHHRPVKWVFSRSRTSGYRQPSTPTVEYGCPPSVCTIQYDHQK